MFSHCQTFVSSKTIQLEVEVEEFHKVGCRNFVLSTLKTHVWIFPYGLISCLQIVAVISAIEEVIFRK